MQQARSRTTHLPQTPVNDAAECTEVPTVPPASRVLTIAEVARELRCSKAHVHNLINGKVQGTSPLPSLSLGRRRLIRRSSLDEWINANEHTH